MRIYSVLVLLLFHSAAVFAHVGSPEVYYDGYAGPYHLLVTIRPPAVIPGLAQVEVRALSSDVAHIEIVPVPMQHSEANLVPKPEEMLVSTEEPETFVGNVWIMLRGSWKIQLTAQGKAGNGELAVPLPAVAMKSPRMAVGLGVLLGGFGSLLVLGLLGIVHAANAEADMPEGHALSPARRYRAKVRTGVAMAVIAAHLVFGYLWWAGEAKVSAAMKYTVPHLHVELRDGTRLTLRLGHSEASGSRKFFLSGGSSHTQASDLVPDHGHLLHLFLVRAADTTSFWHLHPVWRDGWEFEAKLPRLPAGEYRVYGDIVHESGFPETEVGSIILPAIPGQPVTGDDSGDANLQPASGDTYRLPDGSVMVWEKRPSSLRAEETNWFRFHIEDADGTVVTDLEPYMGMAGHAVFLSNDGTVFAHVHPEGSVSMAALAMAQNARNMRDDAMALMHHHPMSSEVSFPYGFPKPGEYHVFVQVRRSGRIMTGAFAVRVEK